MNWKAGDEAIISVPTKDDIAKVSGKTCVLYEYLGTTMISGINVNCAWSVIVDGVFCACAEPLLRKPYDGNELCEWKDCVFQPEVVTT